MSDMRKAARGMREDDLGGLAGMQSYLAQRNPGAAATLYAPGYEHDSCGVGFVARVDGRREHAILQTALECVRNLTHRGALIDARTGDGAGVLTQLPHA